MKRTLRSQTDFRQVLLRNQLTSLVLFESLTTTSANAKLLIPFVNRFFTSVKEADLTAKRHAHEILLDKNAVKKTFEEILPRFKGKPTSFIRQYKLMPRRGDNAPQTLVTFTQLLAPVTKKEASEPKAKATK